MEHKVVVKMTLQELEKMEWPDLVKLLEKHECMEGHNIPCIVCNEARQRVGGSESKYNSHEL